LDIRHPRKKERNTPSRYLGNHYTQIARYLMVQFNYKILVWFELEPRNQSFLCWQKKFGGSICVDTIISKSSSQKTPIVVCAYWLPTKQCLFLYFSKVLRHALEVSLDGYPQKIPTLSIKWALNFLSKETCPLSLKSPLFPIKRAQYSLSKELKRAQKSPIPWMDTHKRALHCLSKETAKWQDTQASKWKNPIFFINKSQHTLPLEPNIFFIKRAQHSLSKET